MHDTAAKLVYPLVHSLLIGGINITATIGDALGSHLDEGFYIFSLAKMIYHGTVRLYHGKITNAMGTIDITDETVKVCAYNFSKSAFLQAVQAIIVLTLRTI